MAVTARDILFIMRAQDFATREVDRVSRSFGRVSKQMAVLNASIVTSKDVSRAQIDTIKARHGAELTAAKVHHDNIIKGHRLQNAASRTRMANARESLALDRTLSDADRRGLQRFLVTERTKVAATSEAVAKQGVLRDKNIKQIKDVEAHRIASAKRAADAEIAQAQRALDQIALRRRRAQQAIRTGGALVFGGAVLGVGGALGLAGLGGAAMQFSELETALRYVSTQMPEVNASLSELQQIVDNISTTIPVARDEITEAMFDIASSVDLSADRFKALQELEGLTTIFSAAAVAGQTDVRTVTRMGVQLANAYQTGFGAVGKIMADTFQLVRFGIGEYEEFANVLGRATPVARGFGQELESVFGSFIFLTRFGLKASEAASAIPRLLQQVFRGESRENIKALGVDIMDAGGNVRQFHDILSDVFNSSEFKALSDEGRMDFFTTLTGREGRLRSQNFYNNIQNSIEVLDDFIERINDPNVDADAMIEAFETMFGTTETSIQLMKNSWRSLVDLIGSDVIDTFRNIIDNIRAFINILREMDPETRKSIIRMVGIGSAIALVSGITIALIGVFVMLAGVMSLAFGTGAIASAAWASALLFGIPLIIGILAALILNWESVTEGFSNGFNAITRGLGGLVSAFGTAMSAIWSVVVKFAELTYQAMQMFNPFARFSPSLVDNVKTGVDAIVTKYGELKNIIPAIDSARAAVERLRSATQSLADAQSEREQTEINDLLGIAGSGAIAAYAAAERAVENLRREQEKIIPVYRREAEQLERLESALDAVQAEYDAQQAVINILEREHSALNYQLQLQERTLDRIGDALSEANANFDAAKSAVDDITRSIQEAERAMQEFAQAPLTGQGEFEDKMFDLEQQALKVRQEMTKWKAAGAPPEALDFFNLQLEEIQNQMEQLEIERELEVGPLQHELEQLADTQQELTFEEAIEGILAAQEEINNLEDALPGATAEMEEQQAIVDELQASFDAQESIVNDYREQLEALRDTMEDENRVLELIAERLEIAKDAYDDQQEVVNNLESAYDDLATEISRLEGVMDNILQAARDQKQALEEAAEAAGGFAEELAALDKGPLGEDLVPVGIEDLDLSGITDITKSIEGFIDKLREFRQTWRDFHTDLGRMVDLIATLWRKLIVEPLGAAAWAIDTFFRGPVKRANKEFEKALAEGNKIYGKASDGLKTMHNEAVDGWEARWNTMSDHVPTTLRNIKQSIDDEREPILSALRLIMFIATGNWAGAWQEVQRLTGKGMDDAGNKVSDKKGELSDKVRTAASVASAAFGSFPRDLYISARTAMDRVKKGIDSKIWKAVSAGKSIVNTIKNEWDLLKPLNMGINFVQGLIDGLRNGNIIKKLKDAVDDITGTVTKGVSKGWDMKSPSKVAMYHGNMFGMGLGIGIASMQKDVVDEAIAIAKAAADALDPSQVDTTSNGLNGISPVDQIGRGRSTRSVTLTIEEGAIQVTIEGNADEATVDKLEEMLEGFMSDLSDELRTGSKADA